MKETFRLSMLWLHTWAGVVLGSVLFAIFWMGSLSVFDHEIDRWMMPETRIAEPPVGFSLDTFAGRAAEIAPEASEWSLSLPRERVPYGYFSARDTSGTSTHRFRIDVTAGEAIPESETLAGTGFIYPFHYMLHLQWMNLGMWIVGMAAMAMLLLLISGVVVHARLFKDFFTLRPTKKLARSTLDAHNLSGVLVLPFHVLITFSGLVIFAFVYLPQAPDLVYGDSEGLSGQFRVDAFGFGHYERERMGVPARAAASLDAMAAWATSEWGGTAPDDVRVYHLGDAGGYVMMRRGDQKQVGFDRDAIYLDAATGAELDRFETAPVMRAQQFLLGLHLIQFDHWALRWLYFLAGLSGCVLIGTGFVYWFEKRRSKHAEMSQTGLRVVEVLTIGSVTGIMVATVAFFVANRLLPSGADFAGLDRATLETRAFWLVWVGTFAHVGLRRWRGAEMRAVWREQTWALAALSAVAPVLNGVTTGMHPLRAAGEGQWAVLGMDALLLATAALAVVVARRLGREAPEAAPAVPKRPSALPKPRPAARPATGSMPLPSGDGAPEATGVLGGDGAVTGDETPAVARPPVARPGPEDRAEP
ncbi:MAG: PepSY domain-containing protein [Bacteroidota bacterium]